MVGPYAWDFSSLAYFYLIIFGLRQPCHTGLCARLVHLVLGLNENNDQEIKDQELEDQN